MARVLLVGKGDPERGGIPSFLRMLMTGMPPSQHTMTLLNLSSTHASRGGTFSVTNVTRTLVDTRALWRTAAGQDVVHIHTALAPGVTAARTGLLSAAARLRGCAVVVHVHGGLLLTWARFRRRRWLVRAALAPAQRVVAVSEAVETALSSALGPARIQLVDNGVDTEAYAPAAVEQSSPRILFVGLLTERKGVVDLFDASRLLTDQGVSHELLLVSGTPTEGSAPERLVTSHVPPNARLIGPLAPAEMPAVYRDAQIFCLPSWWEATPLSVLEAMATGLPVVATVVGDMRRLVVPGETGELVPPRDPVRLADALRGLLQDPETRKQMGEAGRQRVVNAFAMGATTAAVSRIYTELEESRR